MKAFKRIVVLDLILFLITGVAGLVYLFLFTKPNHLYTYTVIMYMMFIPNYIYFLAKPFILKFISSKNNNLIYPINQYDPYKKFLYFLIPILIFYLIMLYVEPNNKLFVHLGFGLSVLNLLHLFIFFNSRKRNCFFSFIELKNNSLFICDSIYSDGIQLIFPKDNESVLLEEDKVYLEGFLLRYLMLKSDPNEPIRGSFVIPFNTLMERDVLLIKTFLKQFCVTETVPQEESKDFKWFGLLKNQT